MEVNLALSSPSVGLAGSSSSSLHLSSSPTAKIVSPSKLSLGGTTGFCGLGAGRGETSRLKPPLFGLRCRGAGSYAGGLSPRPSSSSRESRRDAISKPSSSCAICSCISILPENIRESTPYLIAHGEPPIIRSGSPHVRNEANIGQVNQI